MNESYLLDSSILIQAFFKRDPKAIKSLSILRSEGKIYIASLVFAEIGTGLTDSQAKIVLPLLEELGEVIAINYSHALRAGSILRKYRDNGISFADGLIAGVAIIENLTLVSLDKNFMIIKELKTWIKKKVQEE